MRKEDFFEVLGELDDSIVEGAKTSMKKKTNWTAWGAIAACLALAIGIFIFHAGQYGDKVMESGTADAAPMVYVNDTLYIQSSDQQGYPEHRDEFTYLGKIESHTTEESTPHQNFQANDSIVGCEVYQYGEHIVVKINDAYWLYRKYGTPEINWDDLSETEKEQLDPTYQAP